MKMKLIELPLPESETNQDNVENQENVQEVLELNLYHYLIKKQLI